MYTGLAVRCYKNDDFLPVLSVTNGFSWYNKDKIMWRT